MALPAIIAGYGQQSANYGAAIGEQLKQLGQEVGKSLAMEAYQKQAINALPGLQQQLSQAVGEIGSGNIGQGYQSLLNTALSNPEYFTNPILSQVINTGITLGKQAGDDYTAMQAAQLRGQGTTGLADLYIANQLGLPLGQRGQPATTPTPSAVTTPPPNQERVDFTSPNRDYVVPGGTPVVDTLLPGEEVAQAPSAMQAPSATQELALQNREKIQQELEGGKTLADILGSDIGGQVFEFEQVAPYTEKVSVTGIGKYIPGAEGIARLKPQEKWSQKAMTIGSKSNSINFGKDDPDYKFVEEGQKFITNVGTAISILDRSDDIKAAIKDYGGFPNVPFPKPASGRSNVYQIPKKNGGGYYKIGQREFDSYVTLATAAINGITNKNPIYGKPADETLPEPGALLKQPRQAADPTVVKARNELMKKGIPVTSENVLKFIQDQTSFDNQTVTSTGSFQ